MMNCYNIFSTKYVIKYFDIFWSNLNRHKTVPLMDQKYECAHLKMSWCKFFMGLHDINPRISFLTFNLLVSKKNSDQYVLDQKFFGTFFFLPNISFFFKKIFFFDITYFWSKNVFYQKFVFNQNIFLLIKFWFGLL